MWIFLRNSHMTMLLAMWITLGLPHSSTGKLSDIVHIVAVALDTRGLMFNMPGVQPVGFVGLTTYPCR